VERLAAWCERSGVWLRHFQAITDQAAPAPVPADTLLGHIDRLLDACGPVGVPGDDRAAILDFCHRRLDGVRARSFPVVGAHPDFQPDNIVIGPDGITVLDFTSFRHSPPCSDPARFIAALEFLAKHPLYDPGALRALGAAFLRGYGARDPALDGVLAVYVLRYVLLAATALAELRASALVQSAIHQRGRRFLTTWCRQFLATGGAHVLPGERPTATR
jgi:Ser/Thr protein kinase RdoA (MazF antagonist)